MRIVLKSILIIVIYDYLCCISILFILSTIYLYEFKEAGSHIWLIIQLYISYNIDHVYITRIIMQDLVRGGGGDFYG